MPSALPRLTTSKGITPGSTLAALRAAYRRLNLVGTDRYEAVGGLAFTVASGTVVELKSGICGDF